MVCGAMLNRGALFEEDARSSEVCSDECYRSYMDPPEEDEGEG